MLKNNEKKIIIFWRLTDVIETFIWQIIWWYWNGVYVMQWLPNKSFHFYEIDQLPHLIRYVRTSTKIVNVSTQLAEQVYIKFTPAVNFITGNFPRKKVMAENSKSLFLQWSSSRPARGNPCSWEREHQSWSKRKFIRDKTAAGCMEIAEDNA